MKRMQESRPVVQKVPIGRSRNYLFPWMPCNALYILCMLHQDRCCFEFAIRKDFCTIRKKNKLFSARRLLTLPYPNRLVSATTSQIIAVDRIRDAFTLGLVSFEGACTLPQTPGRIVFIALFLFPNSDVRIEGRSGEHATRWCPSNGSNGLCMSGWDGCDKSKQIVGVSVQSDCLVGRTGCNQRFFYVPSDVPCSVFMAREIGYA